MTGASEAALPGQASDLLPGDPFSVGSYTLIGRLGAGGMGTVYLALAEDGRQVALKMVRAELAEDEEFVRRFHHEVQAARRVAGFCTARVLDAGLDEPSPYLVTEYVEGARLDHAVERGGPLRDSNLEGFAVGVAAALAAIHAAGLVHRDLKPSNVLLSQFGPRVIDFGIARALDSTTALTRMNVVMGTPGWMAPEQVTDQQEVSTAADVFAWGGLVAYAASGQPPFGEGSLSAVAYRVVHERPALTGLTGPLQDLVTAAMEKDPSRRPSARQLLLHLLGGQAPTDDDRAVTEALHRTWTPPLAAEPLQAAASPPAAGEVTTEQYDVAGEPTERIRPVPPAPPPASPAAGPPPGSRSRAPAAGQQPSQDDGGRGARRPLPPAGRPFPTDQAEGRAAPPEQPAARQQAPPKPAAPPPPPSTRRLDEPSRPPERPPASIPREPRGISIPREPRGVSIPRQPRSSPWEPPARQRPASAEPAGRPPGMLRRVRRGTAQLLALPAVIGGAVLFVELLRSQDARSFAYFGTIAFTVLTLAFLILPGSRQRRGQGFVLRLVGLAAVAGAGLILARVLGLTAWDPLLEVDPFRPYSGPWEEYSTRLTALFGILTVAFYGYPRDR